MEYKPTLGSLFDGIAGFPLAGSRVGFTPVWASEIEKFPVQVSSKWFPEMAHLGDIKKINGAVIKPVDVITFGSPCQDLSVAGKGEGLKAERSGLFMDAVRIIREMREKTDGLYPRFAVWENVPGALSSNKGYDFRAVLEEILQAKIPMPRSGRWARAGMVRGDGCSVAWRILDAQYWGVPQRRRRIFLVADFRGQCAPEILFEPEGVPGDSSEGREEGERITGNFRGSFEATNTNIAFNIFGGSKRKDRPNGGFYVKVPTNKSKPLDVSGLPLSAQQGGTGVLDCIKNMNQKTIGTLNSSDPHKYFCNNQAIDNGMLIAQCVTSGTGRRYDPQTETLIPVFSIQSATMGENKKQNGLGVSQDEAFYTLDCRADHAVATIDCRNLYENQELSGTLQCKNKGGYSLNYQNPVRQGYAVRRLTPTECLRLQGFPDYWFDIEGASDTAKYKAAGNSLAVPCAEWVLGCIYKALTGNLCP